MSKVRELIEEPLSREELAAHTREGVAQRSRYAVDLAGLFDEP